MIEAKGLYKTFPNGVTAVKDVSLTVEPGQIYCITGKSGSGKTTLLQLLGLLDAPTKGEIYIDGQAAGRLSEEAAARMRSRKLGFVFQSFYLHPFLTALENVMVPMYINEEIPKEGRRERAAALLERVDMAGRAGHYPKELSGGEQQRIAIARALANDPAYLLADEPTGSLDEWKTLSFCLFFGTAILFWAVNAGIQQGLAQNLSEAAGYGSGLADGGWGETYDFAVGYASRMLLGCTVLLSFLLLFALMGRYVRTAAKGYALYFICGYGLRMLFIWMAWELGCMVFSGFLLAAAVALPLHYFALPGILERIFPHICTGVRPAPLLPALFVMALCLLAVILFYAWRLIRSLKKEGAVQLIRA